jgi:hypothetical protein
VEPAGESTYKAYATEENADRGGSRFVGPVQVRGARGQVWLHGRRIPKWWLFTHAGGRATGLVGKVLWRMLGFYVWGEDRPDKQINPMPPVDDSDAVGDIWLDYKTRSETVSWPVAKSIFVSSGPVAHRRVSQSEAALPALMGIRGVTVKTATQALEKARTSYSRVELEVPIGPRGRMAQLHLEVAGEQLEGVTRVLRGCADVASDKR